MHGMTLPMRSRSPDTRAFRNRDGTGSPPRRWRGDGIGPPFRDGAALDTTLNRMVVWNGHRKRPYAAELNNHRDNYTRLRNQELAPSPDGCSRGTTVLR